MKKIREKNKLINIYFVDFLRYAKLKTIKAYKKCVLKRLLMFFTSGLREIQAEKEGL